MNIKRRFIHRRFDFDNRYFKTKCELDICCSNLKHYHHRMTNQPPKQTSKPCAVLQSVKVQTTLITGKPFIYFYDIFSTWLSLSLLAPVTPNCLIEERKRKSPLFVDIISTASTRNLTLLCAANFLSSCWGGGCNTGLHREKEYGS